MFLFIYSHLLVCRMKQSFKKVPNKHWPFYYFYYYGFSPTSNFFLKIYKMQQFFSYENNNNQ